MKTLILIFKRPEPTHEVHCKKCKGTISGGRGGKERFEREAKVHADHNPGHKPVVKKGPDVPSK